MAGILVSARDPAMSSNKAILLVMLCAAVPIGVAILSRGPRGGDTPTAIVGPGSASAQPSVHAAEVVELSRAPAADPRKSEGLDPLSMTAIAGAAKLETEQDWAARYAGLGAHALKAKHDALLERLNELSYPELMKRQLAGQTEFLHAGREHRPSKEENDLSGLLSIVMYPPTPGSPDGETRRVVLRESDYPELYAMRNEIRWLETRRAAVERDAARHATLQGLGYSK
jgi:hypothetical protein